MYVCTRELCTVTSFTTAFPPARGQWPSNNSRKSFLSFAVCYSSHHALPILIIFVSNSLLHVLLALPQFLFPCRFHRKDLHIILLTGFFHSMSQPMLVSFPYLMIYNYLVNSLHMRVVYLRIVYMMYLRIIEL